MLRRLQILGCCLMLAMLAPVHAQQSSRVLERAAVMAQFADADSRFIDVDGVNVHYKDQGHGPVVLLVHGTLGDVSDWDAWAGVLATRYRVLRLDLPGFGLSGAIRSGNYSVERLNVLIDAFMDQMGAERFAIAGISYGGLVAFRYAATRTERVSALVLANSAGVESGKPPPATNAASAAKANVFMDAVITAADIERNLKHMLVDPNLASEERVRRKLAFANIRGRGEEAVAGRALYERGDPVRVLSHVRAPTLVLWGGANQALNPKTADEFVSALKNACAVDRKIYPDAGHLLIVDQAARSAADALAFLSRLPNEAACRARTQAAR